MKRVYLDYNATTHVSPSVAQTMIQALGEVAGNPSSIHQEGQRARFMLEQSRRHVARLLSGKPQNIFFTSGGTESNNLVLFSLLDRQPLQKRHVVTSVAEHPSILKPLQRLAQAGVIELQMVGLLPSGEFDAEAFRQALRPDTALISVMLVNNETGTIFPVGDLVAMARQKCPGVFFHCDAIQAVGRIPVQPEALGVDGLSLSGHKFFAPKGIGALWTKDEDALCARQCGGGQEGGLRAGTENLPGIAGLGQAALEAMTHMEAWAKMYAPLRAHLEARLLNEIPDCAINAEKSPRIFSTVNIHCRGVPGDVLQQALDLDGFAVSTGSACSSGMVSASPVLSAMGLGPKAAKEAIRVSFGQGIAAADLDSFFDHFKRCVAQIRASL